MNEPAFKLPEYTFDQEQRAHIALQLRMVVWAIREDMKRYNDIVQEHGLLWIHFTDWITSYDLPLLIGEGLLVQDTRFAYEPNGTWQDHFPPSAYRLTDKATYILEHTGAYIWKGDTAPE